MVALSLMPPVDYCASCEGRKAEGKARDIAMAREASALDAARSDQLSSPSPGAPASPPSGSPGTQPVSTASHPLLAADLVVQASLAGTEVTSTEPGDNPAMRLQAIKAYGG